MRASWVIVAGVVVGVAGVVGTGCSSSQPPELGDSNKQPPSTGGPCSPDGATRSCHVPISSHNGILECFDGSQTCTGGNWGACGGPGTTRPPSVPPADAGPRVPDPGTDAKRGGALLAQSSEALALVPRLEGIFTGAPPTLPTTIARPVAPAAPTSARAVRRRVVDDLLAAPAQQPLFAAPSVQRFTVGGDTIAPVLAKPASADVSLPLRADGFARVADTKSGVAARFRLIGAAPAPAAAAGGVVVYSGALAGATVIHAVGEGTEDFVVFDTAPAREEIAYEVDVSRAAGVRLVANTLELLDASGSPRLRVAPPYAVAAGGARTPATLSVDGCAFDASPRAPWGRPVTAPGASTCTVRVAWHATAYPAAVDPAWTPTGNMATAREAHTMSLLANGRALAAGGRNGASTNALASAEIYDPTTATWAATGSMTTGRAFHASASYGSGAGLVLAAGGVTTNLTSSVTTSAEIFDAGTGTWSVTGSLNTARWIPRATIMTASARTIYTGGFDGAYNSIASAEIYDPVAGTFTATPNMTVERAYHAAVELVGGQILISGGISNTAPALASAEIFDPGGSTFTALTATLPAPSAIHTAVALTSGKVLLAAGIDSTGNASATAALYDPATQSFAATGSLANARQRHVARALGNGQVVAAGGFGATGTPTNTSELYDPTAGTWSNLGNMTSARARTAVVLLGSGKVLVAGGTDGTGGIVGAELLAAPPGATCAAGTDCLSGTCNDGICCAQATCTGTCTTCVIGTGACQVVNNDTSDPDTCAGANTCNSLGICVPPPSPCANNPCDPSCFAPSNDAGPTNPDGAVIGSYTGSTNNLGGAPSGFVNKELCSACATGPWPKACGNSGSQFQHYSQWDACSSDYHCNTTTGSCDQNGGGWKWPSATCPGVDLTVQGACTGQIPVCNRGNTDLAAGSVLNVYLVNGNQWTEPCGCNPPSSTTTPSSCNGTASVVCSTLSGQQASCQGAGCTWNGGCTGNTTVVCGALTTQTACTNAGCSGGWTSACGGTPTTNCGALTHTQCNGNAACTWNGGACVDNACSTFATQTSCTSAAGCSWAPKCSGTPAACSTFATQSGCAAQTSCNWNTCTGSPAACSTFTTSATCSAQAGCTFVAGGCSGAINPSCYQTLTAPLKAGQCIDVTGDTGHACSWSGDTVAFVWGSNSSGTILECGGTAGPSSTTGPQCYNNWADVKTGGTCTTTTTYGPQTATDTYVSNCPAGTHVQWSLLNYSTTYATDASGSTDVCFQAQTAPALLDGGVGAFTPLKNLADPPLAAGSATCPVTTPACQGTAPVCNCQPPCAVDMFAGLGGAPAATNEVLKVTITVNPAPDSLAMGTMQSYQISYSCKPSE